MARVRSALLAGFIASSAWMFCALLFGAFTDGNKTIDDGGRSSIAWIGVAFLAVVFLITLLISNGVHHSHERRQDRKALRNLERERKDHNQAEDAVARRLREDER